MAVVLAFLLLDAAHAFIKPAAPLHASTSSSSRRGAGRALVMKAGRVSLSCLRHESYEYEYEYLSLIYLIIVYV